MSGKNAQGKLQICDIIRKGWEDMRILKNLAAAACALTAAALFVAATPARAQDAHLLQALSDLRTARDYIQFDPRPEFGNEKRQAIDEINKAIAEVKHAAWDDGKNTRFAPPSGVNDPRYPLSEADKALAFARTHLSEGVDTPENIGLRARAINHAMEASRIVNIMRQQHRQ